MAKRPALPVAIAANASIAKTAEPVANAVKQNRPIKVKRLHHYLHSAKQKQRREQGARGERRVVGIAGSMGDGSMNHSYRWVCKMRYSSINDLLMW